MKQLNIDRLRKALVVFNELMEEIHIIDNDCPSEYGYENWKNCDGKPDCVECWSSAINGESKKEATANAKTEASQTT